jgi:hypothetical protein
VVPIKRRDDYMEADILTVLIIDGVLIAVELVILAFMIHHIHKLGDHIRKLDKHLDQARDYIRHLDKQLKERGDK